MKRVIYRTVKADGDEPVEVFWIAGLIRNEKNEWWVRAVFRGRNSGRLFEQRLPIGMLPILSLGVWFDRGLLKLDDALGVEGQAVIADLSRYEVITSADVPRSLYPLPEGKAGTQLLFRYRSDHGDVLIPVVELMRALFIHNRAMALAAMRPAGIEQLYYPDQPGDRSSAQLRFTREMPKSCIGKQFAMEFAWTVLEPQARRSWDSILRLSAGKPYVMFKPPSIGPSQWSFRGVHVGNRWFVLELKSLSGRRLPFNELDFSHPGFKKAIPGSSTDPAGGTGNGKPLKPTHPEEESKKPEKEADVDEGDSGSTNGRSPKTVQIGRKQLAFENRVKVHRQAAEIERPPRKPSGRKPSGKKRKATTTKTVPVTAGERAGGARLPPVDFKMLASAARATIGDLDALDETARYMRDKLPHVQFEMAAVQLKQGRSISTVGSRPRTAMVVVIRRIGQPPIGLLDVERTGIAALSMMALHFEGQAMSDQIEDAVKRVLDGLVDNGGNWLGRIETELATQCRCERIPKMLIPREQKDKLAKRWADRLIEKLGLEAA